MNALLAPARAAQPDCRAARSRPALAAFQQTRISPAALIGVVLAHAGVLGLLVSTLKAPEPPTPPRPLMVSLVQPRIEEPRPMPQPPQPQPKPQPKPQPPKPVANPPVLAAKPTSAPLPVVEAPEPTPEPGPALEPVAEVPPEPAPAIEAAQATLPPSQPSTPARPADYLTNPKPPYPALSKRLGEEGTVRLNILVNPDGSVAQLELLESSGHPRLDRSAIATVRSQWKFEPARQDGRAVAA